MPWSGGLERQDDEEKQIHSLIYYTNKDILGVRPRSGGKGRNFERGYRNDGTIEQPILIYIDVVVDKSNAREIKTI